MYRGLPVLWTSVEDPFKSDGCILKRFDVISEVLYGDRLGGENSSLDDFIRWDDLLPLPASFSLILSMVLLTVSMIT